MSHQFIPGESIYEAPQPEQSTPQPDIFIDTSANDQLDTIEHIVMVDRFSIEPVFTTQPTGSEPPAYPEVYDDMDSDTATDLDNDVVAGDIVETEARTATLQPFLAGEVAISSQSQLPRSRSLIDSFKSSREQAKKQRELDREAQKIQDDRAREQYARELAKQNRELATTLQNNALQHVPICEYPVVVKPNGGDNVFSLFTSDELHYLNVPAFINRQVAAKMKRLLRDQVNVQEPDVTTDSNDLDAISTIKWQMGIEEILEELVQQTADEVDGKSRRSIKEEPNSDIREAFARNVSGKTYTIINDALIEATKNFIVNPFPEGDPHRVYAFDKLKDALGITSKEFSIDSNYMQPTVITRMVVKDGLVTIDPTVDGVSKIYNSFHNQTVYDQIRGIIEPSGFTGVVWKNEDDDYNDFFVVHMSHIGNEIDRKHIYESNDGSRAFYAKYGVNAVHVTPEMHSKIQADFNKTLTRDGQWAQRVGHPLDLVEIAMITDELHTFPSQRDRVMANIRATQRANEMQNQFREEELTRLDRERAAIIAQQAQLQLGTGE